MAAKLDPAILKLIQKEINDHIAKHAASSADVGENIKKKIEQIEMQGLIQTLIFINKILK